jgi:hypothetical protein
VFGRWVFPAVGGEVYAEWARADVIGTWTEFLQEPDHAQGYLLGFQKVDAVGEAVTLRVHGELVHLQEKGEARPNSRPTTRFYLHSRVRQGYTHRGQLLGAFVGPGADAQFVALDALFRQGVVGAYFERVRRNELAADAFETRRVPFFEHDTELIGGVRALWLRGPLTMAAMVSRSLRLNRDFRGNDVSWRTELQLGWSPGLELAR